MDRVRLVFDKHATHKTVYGLLVASTNTTWHRMELTKYFILVLRSKFLVNNADERIGFGCVYDEGGSATLYVNRFVSSRGLFNEYVDHLVFQPKAN